MKFRILSLNLSGPIIILILISNTIAIYEKANEAIDHAIDGIIIYVDKTNHQHLMQLAGITLKTKYSDPQALLNIASISKLYVAVAITKSVNDKRLFIDKTLADYFPELMGKMDYEEEITLRMMVQYRSSIPNLTDTSNFWEDPKKQQRST